MESDGDHFLAYYLTKEDEAAIEFKRERLNRDPEAPEEEEVRSIFNCHWKHVLIVIYSQRTFTLSATTKSSKSSKRFPMNSFSSFTMAMIISRMKILRMKISKGL